MEGPSPDAREGSIDSVAATIQGVPGNLQITSTFATVKKHSWRGKYKRIFCIGKAGVMTRNGTTMEPTNAWPYEDDPNNKNPLELFGDIMPNPKVENEFTIQLKRGRKTQTMAFICDLRAHVLSEANKYRHMFAEKKSRPQLVVHKAKKWRWSEARVDVLLSPGPCSLRQLDLNTQKTICNYYYKDIKEIIFPTDCPGGLVVSYGKYGRLHFFICDKRDELMRQMAEKAQTYIGVNIVTATKKNGNNWYMQNFQDQRLGEYSDNESITSISEFPVKKYSKRHNNGEVPVARVMCLTEKCVVERDPASYNIVTARPLSSIHALVRDESDAQRFSIEYKDGPVRRYASPERDGLLSSLLDSVRAAGNRSVHVRLSETDRGVRVGPLDVLVDEETESVFLKQLGQYDGALGLTFPQVVSQFNTNIEYSGLVYSQTAEKMFAENKERLILAALEALLNYEPSAIREPAPRKASKISQNKEDHVSKEYQAQRSAVMEMADLFQALRRLVASRTGFEAFTTMPGFRNRLGKKVVSALELNNPGAAHAAIDCMSALMQPMHEDYDLAQEQTNKNSLLASKPFLRLLVKRLDYHIRSDTGALVISSLFDFFTYAVCDPYSDTTNNEQFDNLLEIVADICGRSLFKLFQHPSLALVKGAGQIMKAIIEEGTPEVAAIIQHGALAEAALIKHLHTAMFTQGEDTRSLTHRELSRHLVSLWTVDNPDAEDMLKRVLPAGLLGYLNVEGDPPEEELMPRRDLKAPPVSRQNKVTVFDHWKVRLGFKRTAIQQQGKQVVLRRRRQQVRSVRNWKLLYYWARKDHYQSDMIWNHYTNEELREALENEYRAFTVDKSRSGTEDVAWNYAEFEVVYHALDNEIKIGDHYVRLLLEDGRLKNAEGEDKALNKIHNPTGFFNDLYHRFLLPNTTEMRMTCLQAMTVVYKQCKDEIGTFNDTAHLVTMIERCMDKIERDRLLLFLDVLLTHKQNAKLFLDGNGVRLLVDLATLSHLHTERAPVGMEGNVLEAGDIKREGAKEWYYTAGTDNERVGPLTLDDFTELYASGKIDADTLCWAQGMDGWRKVANICQLRWMMIVKGTGIMNETELARLCLSMLQRICDFYPTRDSSGAVIRPLPRVKRMLSDPTNLPHIVQLLLTFEPIIVERTATLLTSIVQDSPILPQLYGTGAFLFVLMYTGSNIMPIAKFLHATHMQQACRNDESSKVADKSVLAPLIPAAIICYLENYGPEKFAELFLGEFDTPEAIWSNEMRKLCINRVAVHLSEYTPRLKSNTRAPYQHCPIPTVLYPELENELFCNQYYLRHLCDTQRFPDWPIKNHVDLLRDILKEWAREVDKKPSGITKEECLELLGLAPDTPFEESKIRKAYFRMATKFHPDKNPEGRDMFEKVAQAYEYLVALQVNGTVSNGPDPRRIDLLLRAQSILFSRYGSILQPYKYAGYPQLLRTIELEKDDDTLFSKPTPLLPAASELAYHTVNTSPLNAEEMRREGGIPLLASTFTRVVAVVAAGSKADSMPVVVSTNLILFFCAAAQFDECRQEIKQFRPVLDDIVRVLYYNALPRLVEASLKCVAMLALDTDLQNMLLDAGVLWFLVDLMFKYDYTLEESGVESNKESNVQETINEHARLAVRALGRLGGYLPGDLSTPSNPVIRKCLRALLTPYLAKLLSNESPLKVLKAANSNEESPYLIWNNATRAELCAYLGDQKEKALKTGEQDPSLGSDFEFPQLKGMLKIADVYVEVFNRQPTYPIEEPMEFAKALLDYLCGDAYLLVETKGKGSDHMTEEQLSSLKKDVNTAILGLRNIIRQSQGVETCCIGHMGQLFGYLGLTSLPDIQDNALSAVTLVAGNKDCVADIATANCLHHLLVLFEEMPKGREAVLATLSALVANSKLVQEMMQRGALIYLLHMFCNATTADVRSATANLFAKLAKDKLHGPKINLVLVKFLPRIFMDAWKDNPEASINMFEGIHENPELIWTDEVRNKVKKTVRTMKDEWYRTQTEDPAAVWKLPDDFENVYQELEGELTVGGVFIRLYNAQPGWSLRHPRQFMIECFEKFVQLCNATTVKEEQVEQLNVALVSLLRSSSVLNDSVASLGYATELVGTISSKDNLVVHRACISVLHQLCESVACVEALGTANFVAAMRKATESNPAVAGLMADCLYKALEKGPSTRPPGVIIQQVVKEKYVGFLLLLLSRPDIDAASKAHIVRAVKIMQDDPTHGQDILLLLDKNSTWAKYKDQKHDLFLTNTNVAGYLTGPVGTVGYLTASANPQQRAIADKPPPLTEDQ